MLSITCRFLMGIAVCVCVCVCVRVRVCVCVCVYLYLSFCLPVDCGITLPSTDSISHGTYPPYLLVVLFQHCILWIIIQPTSQIYIYHTLSVLCNACWSEGGDIEQVISLHVRYVFWGQMIGWSVGRVEFTTHNHDRRSVCKNTMTTALSA